MAVAATKAGTPARLVSLAEQTKPPGSPKAERPRARHSASASMAAAPGVPGTRDGIWWFPGWATGRVIAGVTQRSCDAAMLPARLPHGTRLVRAAQVHGSSVALIDRMSEIQDPIAGCDAMITRLDGVALTIRSADCVPLLVRDPNQRAIGIAHVGWRGARAGLPYRLIGAFQHLLASHPGDLRVAIGPAIRECCFDVSAEFLHWAGSFVQRRETRLCFDLIGLIRHQLQQCGVPPVRVVDSGLCSACDAKRWYSVRRDGNTTGRLVSFILQQA